jgi:hypothetical protein
VKVDRRALGGRAIHVRDAHQDANSGRRPLCPFDLVQVARVVVIEGRPEQPGQVRQARFRRLPRAFGLLLRGCRDVRFEAARDHLLPRHGGQIYLWIVHSFTPSVR